MELLVKSFHLTHADSNFLSERFMQFYERKLAIETHILYERVKHAPFIPKIVHRLLGRNNAACNIMLFGDAHVRKEYIKYATGHDTKEEKDRLEHTVEICVLEGPLKEAKELVGVLKQDNANKELLMDVLQMYQAVNICFFDAPIYKVNTSEDFHWMIDYIQEKVMSMCTGINSPHALVSVEKNASNILSDIRSTISSAHMTSVQVMSITMKTKDGPTEEQRTPMPFNAFEHLVQSKHARSTILTMYESS